MNGKNNKMQNWNVRMDIGLRLKANRFAVAT